MRLSIDDGLLEVWSGDGSVTIFIQPRRAEASEPTHVRLRCASWPVMEFLPEEGPGAPTPAEWVWTGSAQDALRIYRLLHAQLPYWLRLDPKLSPRTRAWREQALQSLGLLHAEAPGQAALHRQA